jgi:hypothetical protein
MRRLNTNLCTSLTTTDGLLPLSLFGGALFSPMANRMIFDLIVSTGLTLFVIPSLYVLVAERVGFSVPATTEVASVIDNKRAVSEGRVELQIELLLFPIHDIASLNIADSIVFAGKRSLKSNIRFMQLLRKIN